MSAEFGVTSAAENSVLCQKRAASLRSPPMNSQGRRRSSSTSFRCRCGHFRGGSLQHRGCCGGFRSGGAELQSTQILWRKRLRLGAPEAPKGTQWEEAPKRPERGPEEAQRGVKQARKILTEALKKRQRRQSGPKEAQRRRRRPPKGRRSQRDRNEAPERPPRGPMPMGPLLRWLAL